MVNVMGAAVVADSWANVVAAVVPSAADSVLDAECSCSGSCGCLFTGYIGGRFAVDRQLSLFC